MRTNRKPNEYSVVSNFAKFAGGIEEIQGYAYDEQEAAEFWSNLIDRIHWCDILIHELCDLRNATPEHRADLLAVRKRMAPDNIANYIKHLCEAIEQATPEPPAEPERDCRDCEHHRGRDNNRIRYCINADSAAQHGGSLASAIPDCSIASRCSEFKRATG